MDSNVAAQAYRTNDASDASPVRTVAILYDRTIDALQQAIRGIETKDINWRWKHNRKAIDIQTALNNYLDHQQGGEIASNLGRLYNFMVVHLVKVDVQNDPQPAREVIGLLEPLRKTWHELADRMEGEANTARAPEAPAVVATPTTPKPAAPPRAAGYAPAAPAAAAQRPEGSRIVV